MEKSRILISCSGRTLVLAEKLRDALNTEFCEPSLWTDDGRSQIPTALLEMLEVEMLEDEPEQFDFAALMLAKDDVRVTDTGDTIIARDASYAFQAGLFMATLGRKRCFLVHSVEQSDLPARLGGIISIRFEEPADLKDPNACAKAVVSVAMDLEHKIREQGVSQYYVRVPTLSVAQLWQRERHRSQNGDLQQGEVIVCDTQPLVLEELAVQIRVNMDHVINYTYFLYFSVDTIEKICQALQVILVAGVAPQQATDFHARMSIIKKEKGRVLDDLRSICRDRRLRISLMPQEPQFSFRIHNASNRELATVYAKYGERCFIPWAQGPSAETLWHNLPTFLEEENRLFVAVKNFGLDDDKKKLFENSLDRGLARYFPGFEREVKQLCTGAP